MLQVSIKRMPGNEDIPLPQKMSSGSSGFDLHAAIHEDIELQPGERKLIPTGLALSMPIGLEAQVRPRSGLALKSGLTTLNSPGTIDSDYRGEIGVILINLGSEPFKIQRLERIAQLVFQTVPTNIEWIETSNLDETERGDGGFGHTGQ